MKATIVRRINNLFIIQARLTSTRFPGKVLEKVDGKSMIARVCEAARGVPRKYGKVVVAWAHHFPHLDENDVLGRFREICLKHWPAKKIVRLTSDCPLLTSRVINLAMYGASPASSAYYCNRVYGAPDGMDVEVFEPDALFSEYWTDKEHVIKPEFKIPANQPDMPKLSVDTPEDLALVRDYVERIKNA